MRPAPGVAVVALALAALGCGGGSTPAAPAPRVISVGGAYGMAVALRENGCGPVEVAPLPTRVDHTPGATRFQLVHGPLTYNGTLSAEGRFTTDPLTAADSARGLTSTLLASGQFTAGGFEADVTVTQQPPDPACRYVVHWTGTKQGAPNVIP